MEQYIPKSAVVAEIDRRIASLESIGSENYIHDNYPKQFAMLVTLKSLKFSIDTLEVIEIGVDVGSPEGDLGRETVQVIDADGNISEVTFNKAQKGESI